MRDTKPERAEEVWDKVTASAGHMRTVYYSEVLGEEMARTLRPSLEYIAEVCRRKQWPPLWMIVVSKDTRRPLDPDHPSEDAWRAGVLSVYAFHWGEVKLPDTLPPPLAMESR